MNNPMAETPRVYLDANVLKFAAAAVLRLFPRKQIIKWGDGSTSEHNYHEPKYVNRNERIKSENLKREASLIEPIADHVKSNRLIAVMDLETQFETWGLPNMDSMSGRFFGAPIGPAPPPVRRGRIIFCGGRDPDELQRRYLARIKHPRFLQLQKITGGYQGPDICALKKRKIIQCNDAFNKVKEAHRRRIFSVFVDLSNFIENPG